MTDVAAARAAREGDLSRAVGGEVVVEEVGLEGLAPQVVDHGLAQANEACRMRAAARNPRRALANRLNASRLVERRDVSMPELAIGVLPPGVQVAVGGDGGRVGAAARELHHALVTQSLHLHRASQRLLPTARALAQLSVRVAPAR